MPKTMVIDSTKSPLPTIKIAILTRNRLLSLAHGDFIIRYRTLYDLNNKIRKETTLSQSLIICEHAHVKLTL